MATENNQNFLSQVPDLNLWLRLAMANFAANINCVSLGTVYDFDPVTQTATISINYVRVIKGGNPNLPNPATNDQTTDIYLQYPLLIKCPVVILQGGGGYLTFPIKKGDTGLVFFSDREIDTWLNTGQISYPHNLRTHDLSDAIFLGGIRNLTNPIGSYNSTEVALSFPSGLITINDETGERLSQSGFLQAFAGSTAPSGWVLCYGQAISRTTYASLFGVIGTTYGTGDGMTTFNVPDLRGRTVAGLDNMGGSDANVLTNTFNPNRNTLGGDTGEEAHQLIIAEMPSHSHSMPFYQFFNSTSPAQSAGGDGIHDDVNALTNPTGGDGAHQNVQPTLMVNWIIKL